MDLKDLITAIKESGEKTKSYDTTATVRRVEGKTAWVHIPGGVDETPVQMTVKAKPGDSVQVRVGGGKAWITGNASAPPTDDTMAVHVAHNLSIAEKVLSKVKAVAESAARIAGNTDQYFWFTKTGTDTGAHITEVPQEDFIADPSNGGGNLLARSNGVAIRNGLAELATFAASVIEIGKSAAVAEIKLLNDKLNISTSALFTSAISSESTYEDGSPGTFFNIIDIMSTHHYVDPYDQGDDIDKTAYVEIRTQAQNDTSRIALNGDVIAFQGDFKLNSEDPISDWSAFIKHSRETISNANNASRNSVIRLANSHGVTNVPVANACFLITIGSSSSNKVQFCTAANTSTYDLHMRKCSSGSWGSWKKVTFS